MAHIVAVLTAAVLTTAAVWFWNRCLAGPDRPEARPPLDDAPEDREGPAAPAAPPDANATPPAPDSPVEDTPAADSLFDDTPPAAEPRVDDAPPVQDAPVVGTPPAPEPDDAPPAVESRVDDAPPAPAETDVPAAPPAVRWSWRSHRQSGLEFLRVTVTNPGPNPLTVTAVRLRTSDELAPHDDPPAGLLDASDQAVELFGPDPGAAPLPRTLEPEASADAYFPCRDVADWLYGVAESHNLDRNECHLTPECVDGDGDSHPARRKIDYERWLRHGNGPSLREHADGQDPPSDGDDA